jgi:hypothetical protein
MGDYVDIESFYASLKREVEHVMKDELLPEIKETAQDILIREIYSKFTPKVYKRINELTDSLIIQCKWISDTEYQCILRVSTDIHPTSNWDAFKGNTDHTFDEIINEFFVNGRSYEEKNDEYSVDVLGLTQQEMIETGQAIQILYNELKKKFDII